MEFDQDSTTQTGVQNEAGEESGKDQAAETRPLSPREEALARIDQANQEQIERHNAEYRQSNGDLEPTPDEGRNEEPVETQPGPTDQMVRVKVDGIEMELPISEVVKGYQKESTADKRLKEAALRLKEIEEREQSLAARGKEAIPEREEPTPSAQPDETARERAKRIIAALVEGDTEGAVNDLASVFEAPTASKVPEFDQTKVVQLVQESLRQQEYEREFNQARESFVKNHSDLNENPTLASMVNERYAVAVEAGYSPIQATDYAVKEVRQFVTDLTAKAAGPTSNNRQKRKQSYDTITPASGRLDTSSQQQDDTSPASVIAQMRAARGHG